MSFSKEEIEKLGELGSRVEYLLQDEHTKSDMFLIKWLRARNLNVDVAEEMLKNHFKWRQANKVDLLLQMDVDTYFKKQYPYWLNGVDMQGQPVLCIPFGAWDIRKIVDDGREKEFDEYVIRTFERVVEAIRRCDQRRLPGQAPVNQVTVLGNWDKFSVRQTANMKAIQTLLSIASVYEAHYPEILSKVLFINTNSVFQVVFALLKQMVDPRTMAKITCYGSNRKEWEPVVRAVVEEHQIPREFGG